MKHLVKKKCIESLAKLLSAINHSVNCQKSLLRLCDPMTLLACGAFSICLSGFQVGEAGKPSEQMGHILVQVPFLASMMAPPSSVWCKWRSVSLPVADCIFAELGWCEGHASALPHLTSHRGPLQGHGGVLSWWRSHAERVQDLQVGVNRRNPPLPQSLISASDCLKLQQADSSHGLL